MASGDHANADNTIQLPGYALLNFYADYRFAQGWTLFGRVTNALVQRYLLVPDYGTAGTTIFAGVRYVSR